MNSSTPAFDLVIWRDQFIRVVLRIAAVFGIVLIGSTFPTASFTDRILFVFIYILLLGFTLLPAPYMAKAYFLLFAVTIIGVNAFLSWGPWADGNIFLLSAVVLASLLLDNKTDIVLLVGIFIFTSLIAFFTLTGSYELSAEAAPETNLASWQIYIIDLTIIGIVITTAANMLKSAFSKAVLDMHTAYQALNTERQSLEEKVQERTAELETRMVQLRSSTTTARAIAESQNMSTLLTKAASLITERFEYYHVGIYILDDQRNVAYLQASSSSSGKALIGQSFRLESDRKNPLAISSDKQQIVITSDLDMSNFYHDPNFPLTRSRMIMPLTVRGTIIGMIDMHSDQPNTFTNQDAEILQNLADLTAISFDNVRLLDETRNLLSQLENSASIQTKRTWSKLTSRHKSVYQYTPAGVRPVFSKGRTDPADGINIPVVLHGQTIGKIRLKKRKGTSDEWSERERDLVEKISTQVALALENSRLVDEAQKNALRNQMIANFSSYVRETLDLDSVVQTAAAELRRVFDLKEAEVLIGSSQSDATSTTEKN